MLVINLVTRFGREMNMPLFPSTDVSIRLTSVMAVN